MIQNPDRSFKRSYLKWIAMHRRKNDPTQTTHLYYRDTPIDPRWIDFETFEKDMGEPPPGMILGRLDPNLGFNPQNCRWMLLKDALKTRRPRKTNPNSTRAKAKAHGMHPATLHYRLSRGWDEQRALSTPVRQQAAYNA